MNLHTSAVRRLQEPCVPVESPLGYDISVSAYRQLAERADEVGDVTARNAIIWLVESGQITARYAFSILDRQGLLGDDEALFATWVAGLRSLAAQRFAVAPDFSSSALEALASAREGRL